MLDKYSSQQNFLDGIIHSADARCINKNFTKVEKFISFVIQNAMRIKLLPKDAGIFPTVCQEINFSQQKIIIYE